MTYRSGFLRYSISNQLSWCDVTEIGSQCACATDSPTSIEVIKKPHLSRDSDVTRLLVM